MAITARKRLLTGNVNIHVEENRLTGYVYRIKTGKCYVQEIWIVLRTGKKLKR